jgi:hypothetical protein
MALIDRVSFKFKRFPAMFLVVAGASRLSDSGRPLHNSLNRKRFKEKIMQPFKVLQRPLRLSKRHAAL